MILLNNLRLFSNQEQLSDFLDIDSNFYSLFYDRFQRALQFQKRELRRDEIEEIADSVGIKINW